MAVSAEAEVVEVAAVVAALAEAEGAVATAIRTTSREDLVTGSANFLSAETQTSPGETSATSATRLGKSVAQDPVTEAAEVAAVTAVVAVGVADSAVVAEVAAAAVEVDSVGAEEAAEDSEATDEEVVADSAVAPCEAAAEAATDTGPTKLMASFNSTSPFYFLTSPFHRYIIPPHSNRVLASV